jgi:NTE family protein
MTPFDRATVLGPGGVVGTAWMAGLAAGMRRHGSDLAETDLIVGTSAGAIIGAALATGEDLDRLATLPGPAGPHRPQPADPDQADPRDSQPETDPERMSEAFTILADPSLDPLEARRRVGRLALDATTVTEAVYLARMASLITAREWPEQDLLIPAVDIATGQPKVWDRTSGAPLVAAVASSTAMPGAAPPITVNGRRYMEGAFRSGTNTDLAAGARALILVEPLAHLFPAQPLPGTATVVRITPDPAALDAFGPDVGDRAAWEPAYRAGVRQAPEAAKRVRALDG